MPGYFVNLVKRSHVAIHAEDPIGDDDGAPVLRQVFLDDRLQRGHIAVFVGDDLRAGEPAAIDDAGMVQPVREDGILLADQRRDGGQVGGETALEGDGRLHALEGRQAFFQFEVQAGRPGDGADCRRADAHLIRGFFGGCHDLRVVCQPQVVVRAEVEHLFPIHHQPGALRRADGADAVVQALAFQPFDFLCDPISFGHGSLRE